MTPRERLDKLLNFKEFGNPEGKKKICFVGIEEASGFSTIPIENLDQEILSRYSEDIRTEHEYDYYEFKRNWELENKPSRYTKVYEYMAKIITFLKRDLSEKEVLDKYLFTEKGYAFQMNLYPIGKNRVKNITRDIEDSIRFGLLNIGQYIEIVKKVRYEVLRTCWENNKDNFVMTICFGKGHWNEYSDLFGLNDKPYKDFGLIRYYERENVMLTPFFKSGRGCLNLTELVLLNDLLYGCQIVL